MIHTYIIYVYDMDMYISMIYLYDISIWHICMIYIHDVSIYIYIYIHMIHTIYVYTDIYTYLSCTQMPREATEQCTGRRHLLLARQLLQHTLGLLLRGAASQEPQQPETAINSVLYRFLLYYIDTIQSYTILYPKSHLIETITQLTEVRWVVLAFFVGLSNISQQLAIPCGGTKTTTKTKRGREGSFGVAKNRESKSTSDHLKPRNTVIVNY